jgi:hypothetical protein
VTMEISTKHLIITNSGSGHHNTDNCCALSQMTAHLLPLMQVWTGKSEKISHCCGHSHYSLICHCCVSHCPHSVLSQTIAHLLPSMQAGTGKNKKMSHCCGHLHCSLTHHCHASHCPHSVLSQKMSHHCGHLHCPLAVPLPTIAMPATAPAAC